MKKLLLVLLLLLLSVCTVSAHSGRTDSNGGHHDGADYHYHHGYPAHQHTNGTCPYDFNDQTRHQDGTRSSSVNPVSPSSEPASESRPDHSVPAFLIASTISLLLIYIFYQRSERKRLLSDLLEKKKDILSLQTRLSVATDECQSLESELLRFKKAKASLERDLLSSSKNNTFLRSELQQLSTKNNSLETQLNRSLAELDEITRPR